MHRFIRAAAFASMIGATSSLANAQELPPLLNDLPPGYNMEDSLVLDILGVALGQPREEARAAIAAAFPGVNINPEEVAVAVNDGRGNAFAMRHYSSDNVAAFDYDGLHRIYLQANYSTATTGERVTEVMREADFGDNQPDANAFIAALKAKYGEPSLARSTSGGFELHYVWYEGKPVQIAEERIPDERFDSEPSPVKCLDISRYGGYTFVQDREDRAPGCTVHLVVEITYGRRDDLMQMMRMTIVDHRRLFDNAVLTDTYMSQELDKVIASSGAAAAPAL
jgi:hypothetical protein